MKAKATFVFLKNALQGKFSTRTFADAGSFWREQEMIHAEKAARLFSSRMD